MELSILLACGSCTLTMLYILGTTHLQQNRDIGVFSSEWERGCERGRGVGAVGGVVREVSVCWGLRSKRSIVRER